MNKILKIIIRLFLLSISLNAYENIVNNEPYFKKEIEKNNTIAVLNSEINENCELRGKQCYFVKF